MTVVLAGLAHWLALPGCLALPGLVLLAGLCPTPREGWLELRQLARPLLWLTLLALLGQVVLASLDATGDPAALWQPAQWRALVLHTHSGRLLGLRLGLLGVAAALLSVRGLAARWPTVLALMALVLQAFAGHAAADDGVFSGLVETAHLVLAGLWSGGLLGLAWLTLGRQPTPAVQREALRLFSGYALPAMAGLIASGLWLAYGQIGDVWASLVATPYGGLLLLKLTLLGAILGCAAHLRWRVLPRLALETDPQSLEQRHALRLEAGLALLLLAAAGLLAQTEPGRHATIAHWPWPFRFTLAATWPDPQTPPRLALGLTLCVLGLAGALRARNGHTLHRWLWGMMAGAGLLGTLYTLAVPASADTYRASPVAFDALSIARGGEAYAAHCTGCHGLQGRGDGPLAGRLPRPPVDLLTEPHTARHTAGDFFHWLNVGIPDSGMPPFGGVLDEDTRWDVINFLHALNRGYEARVLGANVMPAPEPRLAAPAFDFTTADGVQGALADFEEQNAVLLVLSTSALPPARLQALATLPWSTLGARVLVIAPATDTRAFPFATSAVAPEIHATYRLYRRTLENPDVFGVGAPGLPLELLIDRYGYLRARWTPQRDGTGWWPTPQLRLALEALAKEPRLLPPPGAHVH